MIVALVSALFFALSPNGLPQTTPPSWGGGGPDSFGYIYLDSDTVCPGAPTYEWIDIKNIGTKVTGLADDNVVGPFDIGFAFPYYWYKVTQVYVGSNGCIAFHDKRLNAHEFPPIPSPRGSNNTLAALMSDLDPSAGGTVWVWTSSDNDTFIVQYDSVPFWSTGGRNTFQIILSLPDSSITFQYKEQSGTPYGGWTPESNQCGIENVSGKIGLNYLSGNIPPGNMYHADLAVKFIPPESTTYEVHDACVRNAMNENSGGIFVLRNTPITFWGIYQNTGNKPEGSFTAVARVRNLSGAVMFIDSTTVQPLDPGATDSVVFPNTWTPTTNGTFVIQVIAKLPNDAVPINDTANIELRVVTLPATLTYDRGTPSTFYSWNGPGGYGARFVPPVYPCTITTARVYMQAATSTPCAIGIFDDNGIGGSPGDTLFIATVDVSTQDWYAVHPNPPVVIEDGAFFVGAISAVPSAPGFGMDSVPPISFQSWEFTTGWSPSRNADVHDVMANAIIHEQVGITELLPEKIHRPPRLEVSANPVSQSVRFMLGVPISARVEVFDATGRTVQEVMLQDGVGILDTREMAPGIYFARVANNGSSVAKLIIAK
ncbi:MAG: T9SS type A sorting domain-containing protein [candidate division WOR-3 bacterium]